jgi:hypothetical protein
MKTQTSPDRFLRLAVVPWSLGVALGLILFIAPHPEWHQDLIVFRQAAESLRHPYWARWLFALLAWPPQTIAFIGLELACTGLLYLSVRAFGGRHWMVFTSFAFAWTIYYGQIDGLVVGGLGLAWLAVQRGNPWLAGVGLLLASLKPQLGLPLGLALWWWSPDRLKALLPLGLAAGLSFLQWGWWVPGWAAALFQTGDLVWLSRNLSLWTVVGPWALLVWPLVALLPLPRPRKLIAIAAATALSVPYFPLPSAVLFLGMAIPWPFWLAAQLPLLAPWLGYDLYFVLRLLPPALLLWAAWPSLAQQFNAARGLQNPG